MSKQGIFNIIYGIVLLSIILTMVLIPDLDDTLTFIFASTAIILTSIFTYSNRRRK